eukprot:TRINITY_DN51021_c0_g1_i1.p1 TRINITY_DN51021_c0_g1~~TRINITY_DN51021_c0_g1_i1.p1  ORF type:complete len:777 (-),score=95.73 TRINITY_DN51021_c0_g1_i1:181-2439(-)
MTTLVRCGLLVESAGRPLHLEKGAKVIGVEVADLANPTGMLPVRVLGYKREIRFGPRELRQLVDNRRAEGRLGIVLRDGMKVILSKAQPAQLELLMRALKPVAAGSGKSLFAARGKPDEKTSGEVRARADVPAVDTSAREPSSIRHGLRGLLSGPAAGAAVVSTDEDSREPAQKRHCLGLASPGTRSSTSCEIALAAPTEGARPATSTGNQRCIVGLVHVHAAGGNSFEEIMRFLDSDGTNVLDKLRETCKQLNASFEQRKKIFRLGSVASVPGRVPLQLLLQSVSRHGLSGLDLSGYTELTATAAGSLEKALIGERGAGIRMLRLRGCKALTDVAVRRLIGCCPAVEILDILEIPKLSDKAFDVPLRSLRIIAAGSIGRQTSADVFTLQGTRNLQGTSTLASASLSSAARVTSSLQITSALLKRLSSAVIAESNSPSKTQGRSTARQQVTPRELGGAPLTHLVLPLCAEIRIMPRMPSTLQHLDLRGADLNLPESAISAMKPLGACSSLENLCLARNELLSVDALLALVRTLPDSARLRVLDLSSTTADDGLAKALVSAQPTLTHIRLAGCAGLHNEGLSTVLSGFLKLEVLDVAGCCRLEHPLSEIELVRLAVTLSQDRVESEAAARRAAREAARESEKGQAARVQMFGQVPPASQPTRADLETAGEMSRQQQDPALTAVEAARWATLAASKAAEHTRPLRFFGVGTTDFASVHFEETRLALKALAPRAHLVNGSLDVFKGYSTLPPTYL